jgi:hypothetical protein
MSFIACLNADGLLAKFHRLQFLLPVSDPKGFSTDDENGTNLLTYGWLLKLLPLIETFVLVVRCQVVRESCCVPIITVAT